MNIESIIDHIKADPTTEWRMCGNGQIRTRYGNICPLCWVATRVGKNPNGVAVSYLDVSREMGLSRAETEFVVRAADNCTVVELEEIIRERLLVACRLV